MEEHGVEEKGGALDGVGHVSAQLPGRHLGDCMRLFVGRRGRVETVAHAHEVRGVAPGGYGVVDLGGVVACAAAATTTTTTTTRGVGGIGHVRWTDSSV